MGKPYRPGNLLQRYFFHLSPFVLHALLTNNRLANKNPLSFFHPLTIESTGVCAKIAPALSFS